MPKLSRVIALSLFLLGVGNAGSVGTPKPLKVGQYTATYPCQDINTQKPVEVQVTYLSTGSEPNARPEFLSIVLNGKAYGFTPASPKNMGGRRYIGHAGLTPDTGLEWWEHRFVATLSTFQGDNAEKVSLRLTCTM